MRASVIEYVAKIIFTWPFASSVSRWADGDSLNSTLSSAKPISLATYLATSTSKPV